MNKLNIVTMCLMSSFLPSSAVIVEIAKLYDPENKKTVRLIGDYHNPDKYTSDAPTADDAEAFIRVETKKSIKALVEYLNTHKKSDLFIELFDNTHVFKERPSLAEHFQTKVIKNPFELCGIKCNFPDLCKFPSRIHRADPRGYIGMLASLATVAIKNAETDQTAALLMKHIKQRLEIEPFLEICPQDVLQEMEAALSRITQYQEILTKEAASSAPESFKEIYANLTALKKETNTGIEKLKSICADNHIALTKSFVEHLKEQYLELLRLEIASGQTGSKTAKTEASEKKRLIKELIEELYHIGDSGNHVLLSQAMDFDIAHSIISSTGKDSVVVTGYIHCKNIQDILLACGYRLLDEAQQIHTSWSARKELASYEATGQTDTTDSCPHKLILSDELKALLA